MNLFWSLSDKGTRVRFCWIPSHCGIDGNERVDQLAKGTLDQDIDPLASVHYTDMVNSYIQKLVQTKWDVAVHGRDLYLVKRTLGPPLNKSNPTNPIHPVPQHGLQMHIGLNKQRALKFCAKHVRISREFIASTVLCFYMPTLPIVIPTGVMLIAPFWNFKSYLGASVPFFFMFWHFGPRFVLYSNLPNVLFTHFHRVFWADFFCCC